MNNKLINITMSGVKCNVKNVNGLEKVNTRLVEVNKTGRKATNPVNDLWNNYRDT